MLVASTIGWWRNEIQRYITVIKHFNFRTNQDLIKARERFWQRESLLVIVIWRSNYVIFQ